MKTNPQKSVLITGATAGIGRACVEAFSQSGYQVFAGYRSAQQQRALDELPHVTAIKLDVTSGEDIAQSVQAVTDQLQDKGLYALINNAGITAAHPFEYTDEAAARAVIEVNLLAPYRITQAYLPLLKQYRQSNAVNARVVNIASWAGKMGQPFIPFYNASKFGLIGLTESMYYELALLDIHMILASPGITKTALLAKTTGAASASFQQLPPDAQAFYKPYFDHYATMSESSNNSRFFPTPAEIAAKLLNIVETKKPNFAYNLAPDAAFIDTILTRFVPFAWRAALNKRMFRLNK